MDKEFVHERLKIGIGRKNALEVQAIMGLVQKGDIDKETLKMAVDSKNATIVNSVAAKAEQKVFDKDMLLSAVDSGNNKIVSKIAEKINESYFDKEVIHRAIDVGNDKSIVEIGKHTNPVFFDRDVLKHALEMKNPDIVRATVDHIVDKNIFIENKDKIQKAILNGGDIQNLTAQILSRESNKSFDREMQELVIDIYMDVITDHFKKGDIPKKFPMKAFEDSMSESRYCFSNPDGIKFDSLNKENRFLLLPVYGYGHAFSAVVKKENNSDNISVTYVNLGARPQERSGQGNQYKEFVYKKDDALKVLKDHSYNVRLHYPARAVSVDMAYKNFAKDAVERYQVNVASRDQKVGNCFLKNIEKGIRYALAIGLSKAEDPEFSHESLRGTIPGVEKNKVKFLKPIHLPGEKTNELTTVQLREELVKSLVKRFPEYKNEIKNEWDIYKARKEKTAFKPEIYPIAWKIKTEEDSPVFEQKVNSALQNKVPFLDKLNAFANKNNERSKNTNELHIAR